MKNNIAFIPPNNEQAYNELIETLRDPLSALPIQTKRETNTTTTRHITITVEPPSRAASPDGSSRTPSPNNTEDDLFKLSTEQVEELAQEQLKVITRLFNRTLEDTYRLTQPHETSKPSPNNTDDVAYRVTPLHEARAASTTSSVDGLRFSPNFGTRSASASSEIANKGTPMPWTPLTGEGQKNVSYSILLADAARSGDTDRIITIFGDPDNHKPGLEGININQHDQGYDDGYTPLMLAIEFPEAIAALLNAGADRYFVTESTQETALMLAAKIGNEGVMRLLVCGEAGYLVQPGYVDAVDLLGNAALHYAILLSNNAAGIQLLKAGADVNIANKDGLTPLMIASTQGNIEIVKELFNCPGLDFDKKDPSGRTALDMAATDAIKEFINQKVQTIRPEGASAAAAEPLILSGGQPEPSKFAALVGSRAILRTPSPFTYREDERAINGALDSQEPPKFVAFVGRAVARPRVHNPVHEDVALAEGGAGGSQGTSRSAELVGSRAVVRPPIHRRTHEDIALAEGGAGGGQGTSRSAELVGSRVFKRQ